MADFLTHGFKMGAHKCYLFGKTLTRYEVIIESELDRLLLEMPSPCGFGSVSSRPLGGRTAGAPQSRSDS